MRYSYIQDPKTGKLVPAAEYYGERARTHFVQAEIPDYQSPIDDKPVCGRRQRRYDLARSGCRPYEGREAEQREANRHNGYADRVSDARLHEAASRAYYQLSPKQRALLGRGE